MYLLVLKFSDSREIKSIRRHYGLEDVDIAVQIGFGHLLSIYSQFGGKLTPFIYVAFGLYERNLQRQTHGLQPLRRATCSYFHIFSLNL